MGVKVCQLSVQQPGSTVAGVRRAQLVPPHQRLAAGAGSNGQCGGMEMVRWAELRVWEWHGAVHE